MWQAISHDEVLNVLNKVIEVMQHDLSIDMARAVSILFFTLVRVRIYFTCGVISLHIRMIVLGHGRIVIVVRAWKICNASMCNRYNTRAYYGCCTLACYLYHMCVSYV